MLLRVYVAVITSNPWSNYNRSEYYFQDLYIKSNVTYPMIERDCLERKVSCVSHLTCLEVKVERCSIVIYFWSWMLREFYLDFSWRLWKYNIIKETYGYDIAFFDRLFLGFILWVCIGFHCGIWADTSSITAAFSILWVLFWILVINTRKMLSNSHNNRVVALRFIHRNEENKYSEKNVDNTNS